MADERKHQTNKHSVTMEQRERLYVTGVIDVITFDEGTVVAETHMGVLVVRGINLHVSKLNLDNGELNIDGEIDAILYEEENFTKGKGASFLSKIFK